MSDDRSEPSSPESAYDDGQLLNPNMNDEITNQLAISGPVGVAAAAAVATGRKRKRGHAFETNPSIRKRQQTRLLRKMRDVLDEYTVRVGQQAAIICCTPSKPNEIFKAFGAKPLEDVLRSLKPVIMQNLDNALQQQAPQVQQDNTGLFELPPLVCDGIPTPVDKMTQAQLRAFIPLMLKYSTGRGKPGWGKDSLKPVWWPKDLPWQNVRSDARSEEEKQRVPWTHALRDIIKSCYKHHGREDLLPEFTEAAELKKGPNAHYASQHLIQINNGDGTVTVLSLDPSQGLPDATETSQAIAALKAQSDLGLTMMVQQQTGEVTAAEVLAGSLQHDHATGNLVESHDHNPQVVQLHQQSSAAQSHIGGIPRVTMTANSVINDQSEVPSASEAVEVVTMN